MCYQTTSFFKEINMEETTALSLAFENTHRLDQESVIVRYNQIFTLLALNVKDNASINLLLNNLFDYITFVLVFKFDDVGDTIAMLLHDALNSVYLSKDVEYFREKIPASIEYLQAFEGFKREIADKNSSIADDE